jgi:hypothetical protein
MTQPNWLHYSSVFKDLGEPQSRVRTLFTHDNIYIDNITKVNNLLVQDDKVMGHVI